MQLANARYNDPSHTTFDVDVTLDGETFPFSYHPQDIAPVSIAVRAVLDGGGLSIANYVAPPPTIDDYSRAIDAHVDGVARSRKYRSADAITAYLSCGVARYEAEAETFVVWRGAVWNYAEQELARVLSGQRGTPTITEFIAELPVFEWPET